MSGQRDRQPLDPEPQQPARAHDGPQQPHEIPHVLRDLQLRRVLGMSEGSFYRRKQRGEFVFLQLRPQLPGPTQYSGALLTRWLAGELIAAPGSRLFFASAERRRAHANQPVAKVVGRRHSGSVAANTSAAPVKEVDTK